MAQDTQNNGAKYSIRCAGWFTSLALIYSVVIGFVFQNIVAALVSFLLLHILLGIPWAIVATIYYKYYRIEVEVKNWENLLILLLLPFLPLLILWTPYILFMVFLGIGMTHSDF